MLGDKLRKLRTDNQLTQKEFAQIFGLSDARYSQYETGRRTPDLETLASFAKYYGVSLDYITGFSDLIASNATTSKVFCKRLRQLRREYNMTQADLGDKLGVGKTTISNYETGNICPDSENILKLSKIFEVTTDYLLGASNVRDRSILTPKDEKDISKTLNVLKDQIENNEEYPLKYDGIEVTEEDAELLFDAIQLALKRIKKKNKEKYTPKKYKNNLSDSDKN